MQQGSNDTAQQPKKGWKAIPAWLWYSLLAVVFWGVWGFQSKVVTEQISPLTNQILFTPGMLVVAFLLLFRRQGSSEEVPGSKKLGISFAFLTGILGGIGNIAFFEALDQGTQASIIVPMTALYPMVTVLLALMILRERMNLYQWIGLGLAIIAIIILGG